MNFKKLISTAMAGVMALSLSVPAFASSGTVKVDGSIQLPTINVVLPTTASMVMNPYKMSVKLDPKDPASAVQDQIVSSTMEVKNLSNIDVQVGIKVTGTIKNTTDTAPAFKTSSAASSSTKEAYIYAVFEIGDTGLDVADTNGAGDNTVVLSTNETDVTNFAPGAASAANTLKASADLKAPATDGVLGFKFFGDVAPVTTWTDKDTMAATIAFTFTPVANTVTPSAGDASVSVSISGTSATATFNAGTSSLTAASYSWSSSDTSVATVAGTNATGTITQNGSATAGQTATITVTVTLSNGATITGSDTFTAS